MTASQPILRLLRIILKRLFQFSLAVFILGFLIPQNLQMPVEGATTSDYHPESFWFYPWGKSVTHKGVDIFAKQGTVIQSSTIGLVISAGEIGRGGKYVLVLGPKWRFHYYAHLHEIQTKPFQLVSKSSQIGTVGATGNAVGKPPHLHYTIATLIPYPWRIDQSPQGWRKMFFLNPITYLET